MNKTTPWNKGLTKETDERVKDYGIKVSLAKKGKTNPKHSEQMKGDKNPMYGKSGKLSPTFDKKGPLNPMYGKKRPDLSLRNKLNNRKGELHPNFQGWKSREPYGIEFSPELREQIRARDHFRCQECFREQSELFRNSKGKMVNEKLHIHHIDFNKNNNNHNNLISLCRACHLQTNFNREHWTNYFQDKVNNIGGLQ